MPFDSIFQKIIQRELPAQIVFEDDQWIAFHDIHPQAPVHVLLVPKQPLATLEEAEITQEEFHAQLLIKAREVAQILKISDNYRLLMNVGRQVQAVHHIHLHILGGWKNPHPAL